MIELDRAAEERLLGRPVESVLTPIDRRALKDRRLLDATMALDTIAWAVAGYEPSETAIKAARSASRRIGALSKVTTAVA